MTKKIKPVLIDPIHFEISPDTCDSLIAVLTGNSLYPKSSWACMTPMAKKGMNEFFCVETDKYYAVVCRDGKTLLNTRCIHTKFCAKNRPGYNKMTEHIHGIRSEDWQIAERMIEKVTIEASIGEDTGSTGKRIRSL